jgi:hypothetical protein
MLTIPSTHLVIISYKDEGNRIRRFYQQIGRKSQITLLIGPHFGDIQILSNNYLPNLGIDRITFRKTELLHRSGLTHSI